MTELIEHFWAAGVYARKVVLPEAGYIFSEHQHEYDHLSILAQGEVAVTVDDVLTVYKAPAVLTIVRGKNHRIDALTPAVWFCIHRIPPELDEDGALHYVESTVKD